MAEDTRRTIPLSAHEYEMLDAFLDFHQQTVLYKIEGLSEDELRRSTVPSGISPLSIVKHLSFVHRFWFRAVFAGEAVEFPWSREDPDADWRLEPGDSTESIIARYEDEVARGRAIAGAASLDDTARHPERKHSLRWIMVHMVEEVARHNGHMDILVEQIAGRTGE